MSYFTNLKRKSIINTSTNISVILMKEKHALDIMIHEYKGTASQMTQHINKLAIAFRCYSFCD